jgi:threonine dehydrogenase-like Zn-dependent dehydrogenase
LALFPFVFFVPFVVSCSSIMNDRAAIFTAPRRIEARERLVPAPGPGEVRVRLAGCGICASNLPLWQGREWFSYPAAPGSPGHEGWGRVDAVGQGVKGLSPGNPVAVLSFNAYAEHDLAPAELLVRLPPALAERAFPAEPLACAMNIFERSDISAGQTVAIVGVGFLGALLIQLAKGAGAHVIALSRRPFALEVARRMGADAAIATGDCWAAAERVQTLTDRQGCERVIEAAGLQETLDLAGRLVGVRSRLVIAGFHQDGPRQVDLQHWNWQGLDVINAHERDPRRYLAGMRKAIAAVEEGRLDPDPLFTHRFSLEDLNEGFRTLDARPDGFVKGLLLMGGH